jgi:hypothetical protein
VKVNVKILHGSAECRTGLRVNGCFITDPAVGRRMIQQIDQRGIAALVAGMLIAASSSLILN